MFTHPNDAEPDHKWNTIDGREVTQLTVFNIDSIFQLVGVVEGCLCQWTHQGCHHIMGGDLNLIDDV